MYEYGATVTRVVDGDTVHADVDCGLDIHTRLTIRLYGVNAPEARAPGGKEATDWLREKIEGKAVRIETYKDRREKFGRYLATIYVTGETDSVNQQMLDAVHAVAYFPN